MISNTKVTYQYSPLPMRYYLKKADGLSAWPTSFVFKRQSAAEWNLTWLLYPGVDEALSITDSNSFDVYHNKIRQRFIKIRQGIKNILNKSTLDGNGLGLKSALVSLPASDFALYLQDAPSLLQALEKVCQEDVLALVQARAIQSVEGRLHYRLGGGVIRERSCRPEVMQRQFVTLKKLDVAGFIGRQIAFASITSQEVSFCQGWLFRWISTISVEWAVVNEHWLETRIEFPSHRCMLNPAACTTPWSMS